MLATKLGFSKVYAIQERKMQLWLYKSCIHCRRNALINLVTDFYLGLLIGASTEILGFTGRLGEGASLTGHSSLILEEVHHFLTTTRFALQLGEPWNRHIRSCCRLNVMVAVHLHYDESQIVRTAPRTYENLS